MLSGGQIVYDMEQAGIEPTAYTYSTLLDCLAQKGKLFDGFQVRFRFVWFGLVSSVLVLTFFCLIGLGVGVGVSVQLPTD